MFGIFSDSLEYEERKCTPFKPPVITLAEIRADLPKRLYAKSTLKGLYYFTRDIICILIINRLGMLIEPAAGSALRAGFNSTFVTALKWAAYGVYFHWQGVAFAGLWCLGHEAGHGTLSNYNVVNNLMGFALHTFLLIPYYAWRSTHQTHHKANMSVERDENFVPRTRSHYRLPAENEATLKDYHDVFEDMPIVTLGRMLFMQALGLQSYLIRNSMGSPTYPPGTNHFSPSSPLFKPQERNSIIASNIGLAVMLSILYKYVQNNGWFILTVNYLIPYTLANHWVVMFTYLHHSDPTMPHYRAGEWTFLRGALATIDRPLLGWAGRFFLHNISHDHIAHHIISTIPFYNLPEVTKHLKKLLGKDYNYDSTNTFRALFRTFTQCCFIEDEGDIVFYKNKAGNAQRSLAKEAYDVPKTTH